MEDITECIREDGAEQALTGIRTSQPNQQIRNDLQNSQGTAT